MSICTAVYCCGHIRDHTNDIQCNKPVIHESIFFPTFTRKNVICFYFKEIHTIFRGKPGFLRIKHRMIFPVQNSMGSSRTNPHRVRIPQNAMPVSSWFGFSEPHTAQQGSRCLVSPELHASIRCFCSPRKCKSPSGCFFDKGRVKNQV